MALPVITHNSPVAGSIAWTAFGITFNGVQYPVSAGNTANKFVYWQYNGGSPVMVTTDTLPASLAPEDYFLFLNKSGIGMLVDAAQVTDGSMIVSGSIFAPAIAADQINSTHIVAGAVTATEIAASAIQATHIGAGVVTADKLSVGTVGDNAVVNGSFEDLAGVPAFPVGWEKSAEANGTVVPVTGVSSSGATSIRFDATTTAANLRMRQLPTQYIPVSAASGRKYYVSARMGVSVATTIGNYLRVNWYDGAKAFISASDIRSNAALTTTFTLYEGQATPPATAKYMGIEVLLVSPNVVTQMFLDEVTVHEVTMSAQIGDGQITATKILAGTITGDRMAASTITADKILVTDQTNYWENPDFEGDTVGQRPRGTTGGTCTTLGAGAGGSGKSMEVNALSGSNNDVFGLNTFPVTPGDKYAIRADYKFLNAVGTAVAGVGFRTYGPTKVGITWTLGFRTDDAALVASNTTRPTTWKDSGWFIYTVPAGTYFLQPWVNFSNNAETTNRFHVDNIVIRRMSGGELIIDGAIIASKIATNAVEAGHISANAVTANAIAATAIDGKTITGATVRTAATGARVVMDSAGLRAYDASDVEYLTADSTGLTMVGTVIADGETSEVTPRDMQAIMGNWQEGYAGQTPPGLHFKRMDRVEPELFPRVVSPDGESITIASGNDPAGVTGGPTIESKLDIYHNGAFLLGQDTAELAIPGGPRITIRSGDRVFEPAGIDIIHGGGPVKISSSDVQINSRTVHEDYLPFEASSDSARDALFDPTWGPFLVNGTRVVRTDKGGVTQTYTDGAWRETEARGWTALTLSGSWAAYSGGGGYYQGLRYRVEGSNVRIQGMVKNGTVPSTIATLPAGYRPEYSHLYLASCGTLASPRQTGHIVFNNTGVITYDSGPSAPTFVAIDLTLPL